MNFVNSWALLFLPLSLIPLLIRQKNSNSYTWNEMFPADPLSKVIGFLLKILGALIIIFIIITISEPFANQSTVIKVGKGAQIGLVLDRSASMDDPFSGGDSDKKAGETKSAAASRLIVDFFNSRTNDMVGVITFSNSSMFVLPLTQNKEAIKAAVNATAGNSLFQTNIGAGLTTSAELFTNVEDSGSRAVILLSDGGGRIDEKTQQSIKDWFYQYQIALYWIVIRQPGGISIFDEKFVARDESQPPPQIELFDYFNTFKSPFQAYEAEDPKSLEKAIKDINLKEKKSITYKEQIPGKQYSTFSLIIALLLTLTLLILKALEVKSLK